MAIALSNRTMLVTAREAGLVQTALRECGPERAARLPAIDGVVFTDEFTSSPGPISGCCGAIHNSREVVYSCGDSR